VLGLGNDANTGNGEVAEAWMRLKDTVCLNDIALIRGRVAIEK